MRQASSTIHWNLLLAVFIPRQSVLRAAKSTLGVQKNKVQFQAEMKPSYRTQFKNHLCNEIEQVGVNSGQSQAKMHTT